MAIPKIIEIQQGKVVLNETILVIPEFKQLYEAKGLLPFQYLWAKHDPQSPYQNYDAFEVDEKIQADIPEHIDTNDLLFFKANKRCEELYYSAIRKILNGAKAAVEKVSFHFTTMEVTDGRDGNLTQVVNSIKSLEPLIKGYESAETAYTKEIQRNRADSISAVDEDAPDDY